MSFWSRIRKNHALEHATINLLTRRLPGSTPLAGNATPRGFYLYGEVSAQEVERAVHEALERLGRGEEGLAISPLCGTNLAVTAVLVSLASALALGKGPRLKRFPFAFLASLGALFLAAPLGSLVQKYITTCADLAGMRVTRILAQGRGAHTRYRVETQLQKE